MPTIRLEKCIQCMKCVNDCPSHAIDIEKGSINDSCIHCGHCVAICPESAVFPDAGSITPLQAKSIRAIDYKNLSAHMRSCRSYTKKEVSDKLINQLVENMKHYPSASNARPVEITVVKTPERVQQLNDATVKAFVKTLGLITHPLVKPMMGLFAPAMNMESLEKYKSQFIERQKTNTSQVCHHAPLIMLFHAPVSKFGMGKDDALIWATNTSLYAHTLDLGSCFIGFITKAMERSKDLRRQFSIPEKHVVYAALAIGHPKVHYVNEASRLAPKVTVL